MKFVAVYALMALTFFSNGASASMMNCPHVIYVSVSAATVSVNSEVVAIADIKERLQSLKQSAKYIFYYRENAQSEPTDEEWQRSKQILDAMMSLRLPISLSSKPDFSDSIDGQGNSQPRTACPDEA